MLQEHYFHLLKESRSDKAAVVTSDWPVGSDSKVSSWSRAFICYEFSPHPSKARLSGNATGWGIDELWRGLNCTVTVISSVSYLKCRRPVSFRFLCYVDRASRYICVIKSNLMHYLSSVYFVNQHLHVSGIFVAHHQEVYCIYTTIGTCCVEKRGV